MQKDFIIHPLDDKKQEDYRAIAALYNYAYPEEQTTPIELKISDHVRLSKYNCERYVAEQNGRIAGVGCFEHWESFYHPHKYLLHVIVAPSYQKQSIGHAVYRYTMNRLEKLEPIEVHSWVRSDRERSVRFAEACGFKKVKLKWNLVLNLDSFKHEPFAEQMNAVRDQGIEIKLLSELGNSFERDRKIYHLYVKTLLSIESAGETKISSFDDFIVIKNQNSYEMTFIAVHNEQYVGMWQLESSTGTSLFGGAMGVDESYRQSGISYALAVHGIIYAKDHHYDTIIAHTDENNWAILRLTEKLGFIRLPAQYLFSKKYVNE